MTEPTWKDFAVAIPTVAARAEMVSELVRTVGDECPGVRIVVHQHRDGDPARVDFPTVVDRAVGTGRSWIMQFEDDVLLAPQFGSRVSAALSYVAGSGAVGATFFSRARRDIGMMENGQRWRWQPGSAFSMSQCFVLRASALVGFGTWAPSWYAEHPEHQRAADLLLGAWLARSRARMLVHVPSLVQHRRGPSTLPHHHGARQSESFSRAFGEPS